jgi:hypothetical protein
VAAAARGNTAAEVEFAAVRIPSSRIGRILFVVFAGSYI